MVGAWIRASRRTGIAIGLDRSTEVEIDGAKAAAIAWSHVFAPFSRGVDEVALRTPSFSGSSFPVMDRERDTLRALCQSLAIRPALRARLAEPERARHLVAAMAARPLRARREVWGLRPSTTAVLGALRRLGHRHDIGGRPLPGETPPELAIVTWIERTYHHRRRQAALGRLTPIECEMINTPPAALAA